MGQLKLRRMLVGSLVVVAGFAVGYGVRTALLRPNGSPGGPTPARKVPTLFFSSRPGAGAAVPGSSASSLRSGVRTDGREKRAGARLHGGIDEQCSSDPKCMYSSCSRACGEWIGKTYKSGELPHVRSQQQVFINCVGYCLDPMELAPSVSGRDS